jgi:hypothetical protein
LIAIPKGRRRSLQTFARGKKGDLSRVDQWCGNTGACKHPHRASLLLAGGDLRCSRLRAARPKEIRGCANQSIGNTFDSRYHPEAVTTWPPTTANFV